MPLQCTTSRIPERLHPKSLRAFPAEIRVIIFGFYFPLECRSIGKDPNIWELFDAFNGYDDLLQREAIETFLQETTFIFGVTEEIIDRGYGYAHRLAFPEAILPAIRKLKFEFTANDYLPIHIPGGEEEEEEVELSELTIEKIDENSEDARVQVENYMLKMCNIREITIDYNQVSADFEKNCAELFEHGVGYHLEFFKQVKKISVVIPGTRSLYHYDSDSKSEYWYQPNVSRFEIRSLPIIQAALKSSPKLADVRICALLETAFDDIHGKPILSHFIPPGDKELEVVWFWMAEKGKTLSWDNDAGLEKWCNTRDTGQIDALDRLYVD